jgi:hypothetical protein
MPRWSICPIFSVWSLPRAGSDLSELRPGPNLLCCWMRAGRPTGGATRRRPALSNERPRARKPRLAGPSVSRSTEERDASWFTTCAWIRSGRDCEPGPLERGQPIDVGLPRMRKALLSFRPPGIFASPAAFSNNRATSRTASPVTPGPPPRRPPMPRHRYRKPQQWVCLRRHFSADLRSH